MDTREQQQIVAAAEIVKVLTERYCGTGPKYPDSLRNKLDQELLDAYAEDGTDRKRIEVGGDNVATYSVVAGKPREVKQFVVDDYDAFLAWLQGTDEGNEVLRVLLCGTGYKQLMQATWAVFESVGCVPDGCRVDVHTEASRPHTMLKVDHEAFARAVESLPGAVALLDAGEVTE